jgi:Holliday junction resolvase
MSTPAKETEKEIQAYLLRELVKAGFLAVRQNSGFQMVGAPGSRRPFKAYEIANNGRSAGVPDVAAYKNGRAVLIECKNAKTKPSETQEEFARLAVSCGMDVYLVKSKQDVDNLITAVSP